MSSVSSSSSSAPSSLSFGLVGVVVTIGRLGVLVAD